MNILHITNWYPNKYNKKEAIWIKQHIAALDEYGLNKIYHFNITKSRKLYYSKNKQGKLNQTIIGIPFHQWFFLEILYGLWLSYQLLIKKIYKEYDVINFHIAYPMLTYWHLIKRWVKKPIVITEHWSAYHFNFGVQKQLPRIQKIFRQNIPVITVSQALAKDIKVFSKTDFPHFVVPNVVDNKIFNLKKNQERKPFLFMVSQWKLPKTPLLIMQAYLESDIVGKYTLKIGGYGPLWTDMYSFIKENEAEKKIELCGKLDSKEIADYMQECKAFLHPSDYETFSVVCAEAIASGAYVIVPKVGGIKEVVGKNGHLLNKNRISDWKEAFQHIPSNFKSDYNDQFSAEKVKKKYLKSLKKIQRNFELNK